MAYTPAPSKSPFGYSQVHSDSNSTRVTNGGEIFNIKVAISSDTADAAILYTVPANLTLLVLPWVTYEVTTGFSGGTSSAIGLSSSAIGLTTKGDIHGGAWRRCRNADRGHQARDDWRKDRVTWRCADGWLDHPLRPRDIGVHRWRWLRQHPGDDALMINYRRHHAAWKAKFAADRAAREQELAEMRGEVKTEPQPAPAPQPQAAQQQPQQQRNDNQKRR